MNNFHYAFKVKDIASTIDFYHRILGCKIGRQTSQWVDFDFFGHQLSAHVSERISDLDYCGLVDGIPVPIPHFGCILNDHDFNFIKVQLESNNIKFIVEPTTRYQNLTGEQQTMFVVDYSNNPIEFKSYKNSTEIFK